MEKTREKELREGKIHGRNFALYTLEEIKAISDTNFLYEMYHAMHGGQPETEEEVQEWYERYNAIALQIDLSSS